MRINRKKSFTETATDWNKITVTSLTTVACIGKVEA